MSAIATHLDPQMFADYLARTRWFGGKGRAFRVGEVRRVGVVPCDGPVVVLHLVEVVYDDGPPETYQVPLVFYSQPEPRLDHAFLGWWTEPDDSPLPGPVHAYDALHDREAMACWLRCFVQPPTGPLTFERVPGYDLDADATASLFAGEQSNSSVFFGEDSVLKVFRKVTAGVNPDVEIHEMLTRAGSENVAHLYGWLETLDDEGGVLQLAMLQQFLRTASDGWDLAVGSVRDLLGKSFTQPLDLASIAAGMAVSDAHADVHAHEAGGDFASEAARLGESVRAVHTLLAHHFPSSSTSSTQLAADMNARLDDALRAVPALAEHESALRSTYAAIADLGDIPTQRIHGDLHLGQTLRTSLGWKLVDFEGEPAKPLSERTLPDSRWRDVAGMLRSFDYAPRVVERDLLDEDPDGAEFRAQRASEWAHRNRNHFLAAYADDQVSPADRTLLAAYLADKAVYETVYEARNRPTWVDIPLRAIAEIGGAG